MKLSQEQKLALKISSILLLVVFWISGIFQYLNHTGIIDFMWNRWVNKYIIFVISSIIIYFVSLKLAFLTTKPMKETNQKLKDYNHHLAHEIKTPLSILKSNLELLEMSFDKDLITSSFEEINSMENIVNSLLFLSDNSQKREKLPVSFSEIISPFLNEKISFHQKDDFVIDGDKNLLTILVKNIIENARKYSSNQTLSIEIDANEIVFQNPISQDISTEELKKYFDVFYKWENSFSAGSYGIGLSVVKKICDVYGLQVILESFERVYFLKIKK